MPSSNVNLSALLVALFVCAAYGNINVYDDRLHSSFLDWSWAAHRNSSDSTQVHSGKFSYSFIPVNYEALFLTCNKCINTTRHSSIELYVYLGENANPRLTLNLVTILNSNTTTHASINLVDIPQNNTWIKVNISLAGQTINLFDGFQIQAQSTYAQPVVYVDDITIISFDPNQIEDLGLTTGFSASTTGSGQINATTGTTGRSNYTTSSTTSRSTSTSGQATTTGRSTTPTPPPEFVPSTDAIVLTPFEDKVQLPFQDWSWAARRIPSDLVAYSGNYSYSFYPSNYDALYFKCDNCIDTTKHSYIEFWVNGGWQGNQSVNFNLMAYKFKSNDTYAMASYPLSTYIGSPLLVNTWTRGVFSLENVPPGKYTGFQFQGAVKGEQQTVYVDSINIVHTTGTTTGSSESEVEASPAVPAASPCLFMSLILFAVMCFL